MSWNEEDAPEMSMILIAEETTAEPEPSMNTTMHRTTHSAGKGLSLAAAMTPKRCIMLQHTAATGM